MPQPKRLLLIGWGAGDWRLLSPLLENGQMPVLQGLLSEGARGDLLSPAPLVSPMLWTSLATGRLPAGHGILGPREPEPDDSGIRVTPSTSRRVKGIWNLLTQAGKRCHVISWPCSHPAEPISGVCVSQQYPLTFNLPPSEWRMPPGCVHPPGLAAELAPLRQHPQELLPEQLQSFIPRADQVDQRKDKRLFRFAGILARLQSTHNVATGIMQRQPDWDFMAVHYNALTEAAPEFPRYQAPRLPNIREQDAEIYGESFVNLCRFHDLLLGRLLELAGPGTTVVLCTVQGLHSGDHRPRRPRSPASAWFRSPGLIALSGPGIRPGTLLHDASVLDVTPTILQLSGLPYGEDMEGRPLTAAMRAPTPHTLPSWEDVSGDAGQHGPERCEDPFYTAAAASQIKMPDAEGPVWEMGRKAAKQIRGQNQLNLAISALATGHRQQAIDLFEPLAEDYQTAARQLIVAYLLEQRFADARRVMERMLEAGSNKLNQRAERVSGWREALQELSVQRIAEAGSGTHPAEITDPQQVSERFTRIGDRLSEVERRLRESDPAQAPGMLLILGGLALAEGDADTALSCFRQAEQASPRLPGLHIRIGDSYAFMRHWQEARSAYARALEIDPDSPPAHRGMADTLLHLRDPQQAADHALTAVEGQHRLPRAHFVLGASLYRMGRHSEAEQALKTEVALRPQDIAAHRLLLRLYRYHLQRPDLAALQSLEIRTLQQRAQHEITDGAADPVSV